MSEQGIFDTLGASGVKLELSVAAAQVSDDELMSGRPVELLVCGLTREKIEGGPSDKPMEVWHAFGKGRSGLVPRTIRGRAQLARDLRFHVMDRKMVYVAVGGEASGEMVGAPGERGAWMLATANGEPACLAVRVSIDKTKGRAAQQGRGFAYKVEAAGMLVTQARAAYPELTSISIGDAVAALPLDAGDADTETVTEVAAEEPPTRATQPAPEREPATAGGKRGKR